METDPRRWLATLRRSHDDLTTRVTHLGPEQLRGPSYCDQWSIAQVLSHLGSQAEIFQLFVDATLGDRELPGNDAFPPIWDAWNARTPDQQTSNSLVANEALVRRLEGLSDAELDGMHPQLFGMDLDAAGLIRMKLSEHAIHAWDVAVALDPAAQVLPDAVDLLIDTIAPSVPRLGTSQGRQLGLDVQTTDPDRHFALLVDDEVSLPAWSDQVVGGSLQLPSEALLRLVYGRLDDRHTPPLTLDAPDTDLEELRDIFPGV